MEPVVGGRADVKGPILLRVITHGYAAQGYYQYIGQARLVPNYRSRIIKCPSTIVQS